MATDYETAPGYESAVGAARKAGEAGQIDGFIERMAERLGGKASVRAVFGKPVSRDGLTIIPVARVRWAFGGGAGSSLVPVGPGKDDDAPGTPTSSGSGGGGGMTADPVGYLEIGPDGASFVPITPVMPSPALILAGGATAALLLRGLARLLRR